jgi:hypothetical protein
VNQFYYNKVYKHSEAIIRCTKQFLPLYLTYFPVFQKLGRGKRSKWKMYINYAAGPIILKLWYRKITDSPLILYSLFENSRLNIAMKRLQLIL